MAFFFPIKWSWLFGKVVFCPLDYSEYKLNWHQYQEQEGGKVFSIIYPLNFYISFSWHNISKNVVFFFNNPPKKKDIYCIYFYFRTRKWFSIQNTIPLELLSAILIQNEFFLVTSIYNQVFDSNKKNMKACLSIIQ